MDKRTFPLRNTYLAGIYIEHLLTNGIRFTVIPYTDRVDIETPFELAENDFPPAEWIKQ